MKSKNIIIYKSFITLGVVFLLSACGSDNDADNTTQQFEPSPVEGIWSAPAYGKVYQFTRSGDAYISTLLHITEDSCLHGKLTYDLTTDDLDRITRSTDSEDRIEIRRIDSKLAPGVTYERLTKLPELCSDLMRIPVKGESGYVFNPALDFEIFWDTFNELYLDFAPSGTNWEDVYAQAENELVDVTTEEELADLFAEMITPLQDGHNSIISGDLSDGVENLLNSDEEFEEFSVSKKPDYEENIRSEYASINGFTLPLTDGQVSSFEDYLDDQEQNTIEAILSYARSSIEAELDDNFVGFKLDSNIGYLFIDSLSGYGDRDFDAAKDSILAEKALDTLLTDLRSVEGLIIDLRFNEGGEDEVSLAVASHFIANTKHAYSKQARLRESRTPLTDVFLEPTDKQKYLGPVVILTSSTTASAAEVLVLSLRDLSNVTVIGERSEGKLSNTLDSRVSSDIAFGLSNEFYLSSTGEWFEHSGIPVDELIPFSTLEERNQSRDFGIERAMELLTQ